MASRPPPPPGFVPVTQQPSQPRLVPLGGPDPSRIAAEEREAERLRLAQAADARAAAAAARAADPIPSGYRRAAGGNLEAIPGGPADTTQRNQRNRALPEGGVNRLEDGTSTVGALDRAINGFRDDYAGNTITGGTENWLQQRFGTGTPGQADWWADVQSMDNVSRNQLFGASLTQGEKEAWERTTVNPSMRPDQIRANLTRRLEIARAALRRSARGYAADGYDANAIEERLGDYRTLMREETPFTAGAAAGIDAGALNPDERPPEQDFSRMRSLPRGSNERLQMLEAFHNARQQDQSDIYVGLGTRPGEDDFRNQWGLTEAQTQELLREYQESLPVIEARRAREQWARENPFLSQADAVVRAGANALTLGLADRIAAGLDPNSTVEQQHAITQSDFENRPVAALGGTVAGSLVLPVGRTVPRQIGAGALYGGAYGFNSADGDVSERLDDALGGAAFGGSLAGLIGIGLRAAGRGGGGPRGPTDELVGAAQRQSIDLLPADVGGPMVRGASGGMGQSTFGRAPLARAMEQQTQQFSNRVGAIAAEEGRAIPRNQLGETVEGMLNRFNRNSAAEAGGVYRNAEGMAAGQTFRGERAIERLDAHIAELSQNENTSADLIAGMNRLRADLAQEGVPREKTIQAFRNLRTNVRSEAQVDGLRGTDYQRRANEVLDAMSDDIAAQLDSGAAAEFRRADTMWRERLEFIDDVETRLLGARGDRSGEQITNRLLNMTRSDSARFRRVLEQVNPEEAAIIRGTVIREMGRPSAGQLGDFSINTWATNFRQLEESTHTLNTLFRGSNRQHVQDLMTIAEAVKRGGLERNFSNSGGAINLLGILRTVATGGGATGGAMAGGALGGITGAAGGAAATVALENAIGRMLASQRLTRILARPPREPGRFARALRRVAVAEPALASNIDALLAAVQQTGQNLDTAIPRAAADDGQDGR